MLFFGTTEYSLAQTTSKQHPNNIQTTSKQPPNKAPGMDYGLLLARFSDPQEQTGWSAQRRLHACLRRAIAHGSLPAGTRLLPSRVLAQELGIARNTVIYAYEQLAAEGFLQTDRRGTRVIDIGSMRGLPPSATQADAPRAPLALRAQELMPLPVASDLSGGFAPGVPALADFPLGLWRRLQDRIWRSAAVAQLGYANPCGEMALRQAICDHLRAARGVNCEADQVLITDGTQSSLDLCAFALADAGDTVWIENPGYVGAQCALRAAGLRLVGIPVDPDGIAASAMDWQTQPPKLIYLTPSHQYPTGGVLGLARRIELIEQARACGAWIVEDDYDSEFRHDGPPLAAMQGLLPDAPVIYLGTFSKSLFPALRIGYLVVPRQLVAPLSALMGKTTLRGRSLDQLTLATFIRDGHFARHLRRMRRLYQQRRNALVAALEQHLAGKVSIHGASAGMHLALRFHRQGQNGKAIHAKEIHEKPIDDRQIARAALAHGIVAPALSAHALAPHTSITQTPGPEIAEPADHGWCGLILGYAQVPQAQIEPLVQKLAQVVRQHL
jgi:GntR family transcriptional regulator/MocR family aminotransferase